MRVVLFALLLVACESVPVFDEPEGRCSRVLQVQSLRAVDGDTLEVEYLEGDRQGYVDRIRLIGVDTPELSSEDCYATEAQDELARLTDGQALYLVHDVECTDDHGRALAYVYRVSDELFINRHLIAEGFGSSCEFPPNTFHLDEFERLEAEALAAEKGQWGEPCWREVGQCFGPVD
jgi:micrococcal nuclease